MLIFYLCQTGERKRIPWAQYRWTLLHNILRHVQESCIVTLWHEWACWFTPPLLWPKRVTHTHTVSHRKHTRAKLARLFYWYMHKRSSHLSSAASEELYKDLKKSCDDVRCFWLWDFLSESLCCKLAGKVTQTDTVSSDAGHLGCGLSEKKKIDICCFSFWPFSYEFPKFIKAQ